MRSTGKLLQRTYLPIPVVLDAVHLVRQRVQFVDVGHQGRVAVGQGVLCQTTPAHHQ